MIKAFVSVNHTVEKIRVHCYFPVGNPKAEYLIRQWKVVLDGSRFEYFLFKYYPRFPVFSSI